MKIIIDGDASPVNDISVNIAKEYNVGIVIFSNYHHNIKNYDYDKFEIVTVGYEPDSVDFAIINKCSKKDIVITQDYGLATLCLAKECYAIHPKGFEYTNENITLMLERRHENKKSKKFKKIKKRSNLDDENFKVTLCNVLNR